MPKAQRVIGGGADGRPLAPGELAITARVVRSGPRWALQLRLVAGDRSERRELSADSCAPLVAGCAGRVPARPSLQGRHREDPAPCKDDEE